MKCPSCGENCEPGAKFCSKCGQMLPEAKAPAEEAEPYMPDVVKTADAENVAENIAEENVAKPESSFVPPVLGTRENVAEKETECGTKKQFPKRFVILAGAAVVIVAVVVILLVGLLRGGGAYTALSRDAMDIYYSGTKDTYVAISNDGEVIDLGVDSTTCARFSMDRSVLAILSDYDNEDGGTLFVIREGKKQVISEGVFSFVLSGDGTGIAYVKNIEDYAGEIYLYDVTKGKSVEIADDVLCYDDAYYAPFCISPDGDSLAFAGNMNYENEEFDGFISIEGKEPEKIGSYCFPVAISDNGGYVYYLKCDMDEYIYTAYVKHKKDEQKLCTLEDDNWDVSFNETYSEAVYQDDEGKTYISVNGGEKQKISSDSLYDCLLPEDVGYGYISTGVAYISVYPVKTFADKFVNLGGSIYFLNDEFETEKIVSEYYTCQVGTDCVSLLFVDYDDELYYVKNAVKSSEEKELGEDIEVDYFAASADLKKIYFTNYDEELRFMELDGKDEKIADDVGSFAVSSSGAVIFIADYFDSKGTGDLYYSKSGGEKKNISEDVSDIRAIGDVFYYMAVNTEEDDESLALFIGNGTKFTCVLENADY